MAIIYNPNLVADGLICYIDINNKRCYDGTGLFSKNLANSIDTLSAVFETNYSLENRKKILKNSLTERWGMNFNNIVTSQDFTIQFWINLKDYELPPGSIIIPNIIFFSTINTLVSTSEIFYDGQLVTFNDIPLTYSTFDILGANDGGFIFTNGKLTYVNGAFNPKKFTSSFILSGEGWNFITFSKQLSTIKFFKNNISEEISAPNSATDTVTFNGIGGNNINFMSNHILVYNRALSEQEVLQNYNAFKNAY